MASIPRLKAGSSAELVECRDELITEILSRISTRDVLKMSTVHKRWRSLIFDPSFAHTHHKNCHRESMFCFSDIHGQSIRYQFRYYNSQTGNLSIVPFSREGLDSFFQNGHLWLLTASNGLMCFHLSATKYSRFSSEIPMLWVYNPATMFLKKLSVPSKVDASNAFFIEICYTQNTLKFVMAGFSVAEESPYTLVFDSQSNSWHEGRPLLRSINLDDYVGKPLFFNGVIYFAARVESIDAEELKEIRDVEALFRDDDDLLYMIMGYDVNQDQWSFSIFIPASVGFPYCLTEWEGNLLVCASNSTHEENLFALAANSTHDRNQRIRYSSDEGDGHFVFWILDTEHKLWIRERELDLSHEFHTNWMVSASGGVVWFICGYNSVTVYQMKNRHWSTHRLDNSLASRQQLEYISCISFEPTLLSF
ncbi:hypothetical protein SUGI_0070510 [Cryptomeria japonica]|uniref:F-box/kelch-repeat protein At5g43190 n=1 Tax=Cryptomeria japonica TaxID=3369 RepID=UPI002408E31A|nr:F-box/kelch-repeat protein At5g43190 [Cryptomeria japonica]GLJ07598.1 hypothetical protein SUGI_0070510 [Cryptomeria japonica]